ncbi:hypothetical protein Tco_1176956 [Tanacetum coccineum]
MESLNSNSQERELHQLQQIQDKAKEKCGGTKSDDHIARSRSGTYITHVVDADMRPVNDQYHLTDDLKAQLHAKTTLICNLKNQIKSVKEASNEAKLEKEINVLETINIELESRKLFDSCTSKVDSEPPNGSNDDITNPYECDQTLNISAGTLNLSVGPAPQRKESLLDHKIQQLSKGSSEGSGTTPEVPDEPKDNSAVVAEKQAGYVQTNLTLSSAELEIQSMVDVPIHQEDLAVQRTPLIDPVISMVTEKTASTPTPPTTQAHVQMCSTSCWKDISRGV